MPYKTNLMEIDVDKFSELMAKWGGVFRSRKKNLPFPQCTVSHGFKRCYLETDSGSNRSLLRCPL